MNPVFYYLLMHLFLFGGCSFFSWAQPKTMKVSDTETLYSYTFCILAKGPQRNQADAEAMKIQEGHMAYLEKLQKSGILWLAGPFDFEATEMPEWRGIVILKTSKEEGIRLMEQDPSVSSGRIVLQCKAWWCGEPWGLAEEKK